MMTMIYKNHIKYKIVMTVQYTIAENVPFVVHYHESDNKINIKHSKSLF